MRLQLLGKKTNDDDDDDKVAMTANEHYFIGKTENDFVDIGLFLRDNKGDPAVHVSHGSVWLGLVR